MKRIKSSTDGKFIGMVINEKKNPIKLGGFLFHWEKSNPINTTTVTISNSNYSITAGGK